ncbi:hypothetical protein C0V82_16055 [Niveispirillum cyanobacteriorum]|uniref:Uncharacterized protein n=1 Tax=Niveispirillum cyanobacteriorum TaxID=1612173 RepID=A0A2K9NFP0_9PROT|nr:hypothetical protein C0V82_16055 [Niveispirillum cyanobacteriorum]
MPFEAGTREFGFIVANVTDGLLPLVGAVGVAAFEGGDFGVVFAPDLGGGFIAGTGGRTGRGRVFRGVHVQPGIVPDAVHDGQEALLGHQAVGNQDLELFVEGVEEDAALDKAADGFGAGWDVGNPATPFVEHFQEIWRSPHLKKFSFFLHRLLSLIST